MNIIIVEGNDLGHLKRVMGLPDSVTRLRFSVTENGVCVKVNAGCWSALVGRKANPDGY